jgi:hypothetical protein
MPRRKFSGLIKKQLRRGRIRYIFQPVRRVSASGVTARYTCA